MEIITYDHKQIFDTTSQPITVEGNAITYLQGEEKIYLNYSSEQEAKNVMKKIVSALKHGDKTFTLPVPTCHKSQNDEMTDDEIIKISKKI